MKKIFGLTPIVVVLMNLILSSGLPAASNLHEAAMYGDTPAIDKLLEEGADINAKNERGETAMHVAVIYHKISIIPLLISKGADVTLKDAAGNTPLHHAVRTRQNSVLTDLLDAGADPNSLNLKKITPFFLAKFDGNDEAAEMLFAKGGQKPPELPDLHWFVLGGNAAKTALLIRQGADIERLGMEKIRPLHIACRTGNKEIVELLISQKADIRAADAGGDTPLHQAILSDDIEVIQMLLSNGADINSANKKGSRPLHYAVFQATSVTELLIRQDAHINVKDDSGFTPLHYASYYGLKPIVKLLIEAGADVNSEDLTGSTPLHATSLFQKPEIAELLISSGADIYARNHAGYSLMDKIEYVEKEVFSKVIKAQMQKEALQGSSPLHEVATNCDASAIERLLKAGADINARNGKDKLRRTALHIAIENRCLDCVKLLMESGADIEKRDAHGFSPLHAAASGGHIAAAKWLLDRGAKIDVKDKDAWTPLHYAASYSNKEMAALLLERGADVKTKDKNSRTPIDLAAENGNAALAAFMDQQSNQADPLLAEFHRSVKANAVSRVAELLDQGAPVDAKDYHNRTGLHTCAMRGHLETADLLIEKGADLEAEDANGFTPLHYASFQGQTELVSLLNLRGAEIHALNKRGDTALHLAVANRKIDTALKLIQLGAWVHYPAESGQTPLYYAVINQDAEMAAMLLAHGAIMGSDEITALQILKTQKSESLHKVFELRKALGERLFQGLWEKRKLPGISFQTNTGGSGKAAKSAKQLKGEAQEYSMADLCTSQYIEIGSPLSTVQPLTVRPSLSEGQQKHFEMELEFKTALSQENTQGRNPDPFIFHLKQKAKMRYDVLESDEEENTIIQVQVLSFEINVLEPTEHSFTSDNFADIENANDNPNLKPLLLLYQNPVSMTLSPSYETIDYDLDAIKTALAGTEASIILQTIEQLLDQMVEGLFVEFPDHPIQPGDVWKRGSLKNYLPKIGTMVMDGQTAFSRVSELNEERFADLEYSIQNYGLLPDEESSVKAELQAVKGGGRTLLSLKSGLPVYFDSCAELDLRMQDQGTNQRMIQMLRVAGWDSIQYPRLVRSRPSPPDTPTIACPETIDRFLDKDGSLFGCLDGEGVLNVVLGKLSELTRTPQTQVSHPGKQKLGHVKRGLRQAGLNESTLAGFSLAPAEDGIYRFRLMAQPPPQKPAGRLWSMYLQNDVEMESLDFLSADTAFFAISKLNSDETWRLMTDLINGSNIPEAVVELTGWCDEMESSGMAIPSLIADYVGEIAFSLVLNQKQMMPLPGSSTKIPTPGFLVIIKLQNGSLLEKIEKKFKSSEISFTPTTISSGGRKVRILNRDVNEPLPFQLALTQSNGFLFMASGTSLLQEALDVAAGKKNGLKESEEFRRLMNGLSRQASQLTFFGSRLDDTLNRLFKSELTKKLDPERKQALKNFFLNEFPTASLGTLERRNQGLGLTIHSMADSPNVPTRHIAAALLPVGPGIMWPAMTEERIKTVRILSGINLKNIGRALKRFAGDNDGLFPEPDGIEGLRILLAQDGEYPLKLKNLRHPNSLSNSADIGELLTEKDISYVYIGSGLSKFNRPGKSLPLAFEKPGLDQVIQVLFMNGDVHAISGSAKTCREIMERLGSEYLYAAQTQKLLLEKAVRMDRILGLDGSQ